MSTNRDCNSNVQQEWAPGTDNVSVVSKATYPPSTPSTATNITLAEALDKTDKYGFDVSDFSQITQVIVHVYCKFDVDDGAPSSLCYANLSMNGTPETEVDLLQTNDGTYQHVTAQFDGTWNSPASAQVWIHGQSGTLLFGSPANIGFVAAVWVEITGTLSGGGPTQQLIIIA